MIARIYDDIMKVCWVSIARTAMLILGKFVAYKCIKKVLEWWSYLSLAQCDQVNLCIWERIFLFFILLCYVQIDLVGGTVAWNLRERYYYRNMLTVQRLALVKQVS